MRNLLLLVSATIGTLLLFEAAVRLLDIELPIQFNWSYHETLGWSQRPGVSYDYQVAAESVHVEFNQLGFRDIEHQFAKPANTRRIVVIGDSFSESVQVNLQETYFKQLQHRLNSSSEQRWQVINLGVGDFGTAQQWIALQQYGLRYQPDIILQQVFPLNDICNNSIQLYDLCKSDNDRYRPYFIDRDGHLQLSWVQPFRAWLRRNLISYRLIESNWHRLFQRFQPDDPHAHHLQKARNRGLPPLDPLLYAYVEDDEQIPEAAAGWSITEQLITRIATLARTENIGYLVMVVPFDARVGDGWESFALSNAPPSLQRDYPERRLGALLDQLEVNRVMLLPAFSASREQVLPYIDGHLNRAGHALAAQQLYRQITTMEPVWER